MRNSSDTTAPRSPSIAFCGLRVFAQRNGTEVSGHVDFPYETYGRSSVPIDYQSTRPGDTADSQPTNIDSRTTERANAVAAYHQALADDPDASKLATARQIAQRFGVCPRSIQAWVFRAETEGNAGLRARHTKPPRKVGSFDPSHAQDAVLVTAWWCFRIGNVDSIDAKVLTPVVQLIADGFSAADLLAVIDCYYSWPCDRSVYPFKKFAKWLK